MTDESTFGLSALAKLSTDSKLLETLKKLAGKQLSAVELRDQRLSFILGNFPGRVEISREKISDTLDKHDGTKAA